MSRSTTTWGTTTITRCRGNCRSVRFQRICPTHCLRNRPSNHDNMRLRVMPGKLGILSTHSLIYRYALSGSSNSRRQSMHWRHAILVTILAVVCVAVGITGMAQQSAQRSPDADWPTYNRDLAGTRYSPLTQINTANVSRLTQVWSYRLRPAAGVAAPAVDRPASAAEIFHQITP